MIQALMMLGDSSVSVGGASALKVVLCAVPVAAFHGLDVLGGTNSLLPPELICGTSIVPVPPVTLLLRP